MIKKKYSNGGPTPVIKNETLRRQKEQQDRRKLDVVRNTFKPRKSPEEQYQDRQDEYMIKLMGMTDEQYLNKETHWDKKQAKKAAEFPWVKEGMYNNIANNKRDEILDFKGAAYPKPPTDGESIVDTYEMAKHHPLLQGKNPETYAMPADDRRKSENFLAAQRLDEHLYNQQKSAFGNQTQEEFWNEIGKDRVDVIKDNLMKADTEYNVVKTPMDLMGKIAPKFSTKLANEMLGNSGPPKAQYGGKIKMNNGGPLPPSGDARKDLLNILGSQGYQDKLKKEVQKSIEMSKDYQGTFEGLYNERLSRANTTPLQDKDLSREGAVGMVEPNLKEGKNYPVAYVDEKGAEHHAKYNPGVDNTPKYVALEELEHSTHLPEDVKGPTAVPYHYFDKEEGTSKNLTPYALSVIDKLKVPLPDPQREDGSDNRAAMLKANYLGIPTEMVARKRRLEQMLIEKGSIKAGETFTDDHFDQLLKDNPDAFQELIHVVTPSRKVNDSNKGEVKEKIKTLFNEIAMNKTTDKPYAAYGGKLKMQGGGNFGNVLSGIGNAVSTASPLLNLIPGVGTIGSMIGGVAGAGLSAIGGSINDSSANLQQRMNTNPYGYWTGGKLKFNAGGSIQLPTGSLDKLSSQAQEVNANQPGMIDSVETSQAFLDHGEVVAGDKVFSNKIVNPDTGRTFADDEKRIQKQLGAFEKMKKKIGDREYQDDKYLKMNSEATFAKQEQIAKSLGLREEDGSPTQEVGRAFGGFLNRKPKLGGGGSPPDQEILRTILNSLQSAQHVNNTPINQINMGTAQAGESGTDMGTVVPDVFTSMPTAIRDNAARNDVNYGYKGQPYGDPNQFVTPYSPTNEEEVYGHPDQYAQEANPLTTDGTAAATTTPTAGTGTDPKSILSMIQKNLAGAESTGEPTEDTGEDGMTTLSSLLGEDDGSGKGLFGKMAATPLGTAGTLLGIGSNLMNNLSLKPDLVKYDRIGDRQIRQNELALQNMLAGKAESLNQSEMQGSLARNAFEGRSLQSRNANLRNIATGVAGQKAQTSGAFSDKIAGARERFGQSLTQIEGMNLQTRMAQDDINTREKDSVRTEKMQMTDNIRKLLIESQLSVNHQTKNDILKKLAQTKNFKFDLNSPEGIKFITEYVKQIN
jgi:hypothetical protein